MGTLWMILLCLQETAHPPGIPQDPPVASPLDRLQGTLRVKYRYRATSDESDSDLIEIISLAYGTSKDFVSAGLSARLAEDTDGNRNVEGYYPFTSLDDKYSSFATQRLYTAYLDFRPDEGRTLIRAGRQILDEFPEAVSMDGALVRYQAGATVSLSAFGGLPVNPFEASPSGDVMYGASAEWRPAPTGRYRVEYLHLRDENLFGLHEDDLLGVTVDESSGPFTLHARYTALEGESRDVVGRLGAVVPDAEFQVQLQGAYVFHRIQALSYAIDPYASILMDLQPYADLTLRASKGFGGTVFIDASFTAREFVRDGVETEYNHEFKRLEVAPSLRLDGVTLRVAYDYWKSTGDDFSTLGGDVAVELHRNILLSAGSSYALYSIDAFTGEERERVRLYTMALTWRTSTSSVIEARFTYEDSDLGLFRILEVGFRHAF